MAASKTRIPISTGVTLAAGGSDTVSGATDQSTGYGAQLNFKITNGPTGPTAPAQVQVQVANDSAGTLYVKFGGPNVANLGNGVVTSWSIEIPIGVIRFRLVSGSNTGQNCTLDADASLVDTI